MAHRSCIVAALAALVFAGCGDPRIEENTAKDFRASNLRCEYLADPIGIDVREPRLSWVIDADGRNWKQNAWQILVASSISKLDKNKGDMWDSGKVASDASIQIPYGGRKLESRGRYYWKVRVWDAGGRVSAYGRPAVWEMGLLDDSDWQAHWISGPKRADDKDSSSAPFMRKTFALLKDVKKARVYISGVGYYELYVNGRRIGDHVLDPAFTRYDKRVLYVTYDVTENLKRGENALGVVLGNGFYNSQTKAAWQFDKAKWRQRPALLCRLEVQSSNGKSTTIVSDGSWKTSTGPVIFNAIRLGTTYDARLEMPGWNTAAFDDSKWVSAQEVAGPAGKLKAQMMPPVKVVETIKPVKILEPESGVYVFDVGQNLSGRAQLTVSGPAGAEVVMRYSSAA
jgi:alpha-L-rhamnosidase